MVDSPPRPNRLDAAAIGTAVALLVVSYVLVPNPILQYGVWLVVFCIWMAWFVYYGTRWLYGFDPDRDW